MRTLWSHSTFDGWYPPARLGPQGEDVYSWRFNRDYTRISALGMESVGYHHLRRHTLPTQNYCYRKRASKYLPCE